MIITIYDLLVISTFKKYLNNVIINNIKKIIGKIISVFIIHIM